MTIETEVHELLEQAAARPSRDFDPSAAPRRPTPPPRRAVAVAATLVVALVVVACVAIFAGGSSSVGNRVTVRPAALAPDLPPGWRGIEISDAGLALAVPADWFGSELDGVVIVGTSDRTTLPKMDCGVGGAPGTWLALVESDPAQPRRFPLGGTETTPTGADPSRPADFRAADPDNRIECQTTSASSVEYAAQLEGFRFTDAGRLFLADIITVGPPDPERVLTAKEVLNTLVVQPRSPDAAPDDGAATTTTPPTTSTPSTTSTLPTPATTTAPTSTSLPLPATVAPPSGPSAPIGSDEQAIVDAFLGWLNANPREAIGDYVEDYESIRTTHDAGIAQWPPGSLGDVTGQVDDVTMVDESHATVVYSILRGAVEWYPRRTGHAVKIDGRWMVSRDTVCELLAVGGLTCPPRF
jgi:hypothetical protein